MHRMWGIGRSRSDPVHPVFVSRCTVQYETLTRRIIGGAMRVHGVLGPGFLESVYRRALAWELRVSEMDVQCEKRLDVRYRDALVGEFAADLVIDECVLTEAKAVRALAPAHEAQIANYLTATGIEVGLLLNFGSDRLQLKRKTRTYRARATGPDEREGDGTPSPSAPHPVHPVRTSRQDEQDEG